MERPKGETASADVAVSPVADEPRFTAGGCTQRYSPREPTARAMATIRLRDGRMTKTG
jgi:hypothetical protein